MKKFSPTSYYSDSYFEYHDSLDLHMASAIKMLMQKHSLQSVLDVGCGTGRLVRYLTDAGFDAKGCDKEPQAIKWARKLNKKNRIFKGSAGNLPFLKNTFDFVTNISVIEHLSWKEGGVFLSECRRVLKPGGFLFLVTPNFATPFRILHAKKWMGYRDPTHITFYTPRKLAGRLEAYGFADITTKFKTDYRLHFDLDLPNFLRGYPWFVKNALNYFLTETPLYYLKNAFWIAARKE